MKAGGGKKEGGDEGGFFGEPLFGQKIGGGYRDQTWEEGDNATEPPLGWGKVERKMSQKMNEGWLEVSPDLKLLGEGPGRFESLRCFIEPKRPTKVRET